MHWFEPNNFDCLKGNCILKFVLMAARRSNGTSSLPGINPCNVDFLFQVILRGLFLVPVEIIIVPISKGFLNIGLPIKEHRRTRDH